MARRPRAVQTKVKSLVCLNQCARKCPSYLCPVIIRNVLLLYIILYTSQCVSKLCRAVMHISYVTEYCPMCVYKLLQRGALHLKYIPLF